MLKCSVNSSAPTQLRWIGPNGIIDIHSPYLSLKMGVGYRSVSFQPLHTSHGGVYTCIASVGGTQKLEQQYSLTVQSKYNRLTHILSYYGGGGVLLMFIVLYSSSTSNVDNSQ